MDHVKDIEYRGHEIIIMSQANGKFAVDIRIDNFDGELIGGYQDLATQADAEWTGKVFVQGYRSKQ